MALRPTRLAFARLEHALAHKKNRSWENAKISWKVSTVSSQHIPSNPITSREVMPQAEGPPRKPSAWHTVPTNG